jgi:hypothetical protein
MSLRVALLPCALIAALASPAFAAENAPAKQPELTHLTLQTGVPRAPEQEAVAFELADLKFKVDPERKHLDGDATLTFRAIKPVDALRRRLRPQLQDRVRRSRRRESHRTGRTPKAA